MATLRSYSATVDGLDPEARWRFDEESGASAVDRAGTLNGSYQGGFAHGAAGPIGDGAVGFDGQDGLTRVVTSAEGSAIRLGFLGDSLVAGFGLPGAQTIVDDFGESVAGSFPRTLVTALEGDGFDLEIEIFGQNNQRAGDLIDNAEDLAARDLDVVILVVGTNDSLNSTAPPTFETNLRTIVREFDDAGTEVILTGSFGLWPDETFDKPGYDTTDPDNELALADQFEAVYDEVADDFDLTLFERFHLGERVGDEIVGGTLDDPALNRGDGVHPNAAGFATITDAMLPTVTSALDGVGTGSENLLAIDDGSVEGWFVADDTDGVQGLIAKDADGRNDGDLRVFLDQGRLRAVVEGDAASVTLQSARDAVQAGQAFHVVLAFGAAGVALFLNGEMVDSANGAFSASGNDNPLLFGALAGAGGAESFFDGVIDEVVIYDDVLDGDDVADLFAAGSRGNTLVGTNSQDTIIGGEDDESLRGKGGADDLRGNGGDDELIGGSGKDSANGGAGNDTVNGGGGRDSLKGDAGDDILFGKAGADVISGGPDDDIIRGGGGPDRLLGNAGDDVVEGGPGADFVIGGGGLDQLFGGGDDDDMGGGSGSDRIEGGGGADLIRGGGDSDDLFGDNGRDELFGGAGNDLLVGGAGRDFLTGGAGADVYRIDSLSDRLDKIFDFARGVGGDQLDLAGIVEGFVADSDPNDFVQLIDNGARTRVSVDADGDGGGFTAVADLIGVGGADLDQLVVDGNINLG